MGRRPCCAKEGLNRGLWTPMEDKVLKDYIKVHGEGKWRNLPKKAGLKRCGKSCRLRWLNYLRPDIKRGNITRDEEDLIIRLHKLLGNRWSLIAGRLPGRTDNEIKNYWNTIGKKLQPNSPSSNHKPSKKLIKSQETSTSCRSIRQANEQLTSPTTGFTVIRTKASKCTRVFITTDTVEAQETHQLDDTKPMGVVKDTAGVQEESCWIERLASCDFLLDIEMDEKFLSDLLNMDFVPVISDCHGGLEGDGNNSTNDTGDSSLSVCFDQNVWFPEEISGDADLGSMASLLSIGFKTNA